MYALILSGGLGERLRPWTDTMPKPMVNLAGRPILWHQVQWFKRAGISDVVFLAGHHWQSIHEFFGDGSAHGFKAHYSIEDEPLGRGGAIRKGFSVVPPDESHVVVTNGDIVTNQSLAELLGQYKKNRKANPEHAATIMAVPLISPFGVLDIGRGGTIRSFQEKAELPCWINGGVYVFNRNLEFQLPLKGDHEVSMFPTLASEGRIAALQSRAFWRNIESFKDLREAEERITTLNSGLV